MRAYFDAQKGSLGSRPATLSFRQIVITPQALARGQGADPGPGGLDRAGAPARRRLRHGRQAILPGPRLEGPGRLAQLVPARRDGAGVRAGGLRASGPAWSRIPVESPFGFHIIQVERVQPGEVQARHILHHSRDRLGPRRQRQGPGGLRSGATAARGRRSTRCSGSITIHRPRQRGGERARGQAAGGLRQGHR